MLNKQSPKKDFNFNLINEYKLIVKKLLKKLEDTICIHIDNQVNAGANVIQIFDSWAGLLPEKELPDFCYKPTSRIVEHVKSLKIPVICFPKGIGKNYETFCSIVKPDCISIDQSVEPNWIKDKSEGIAIQGGMDPSILLSDKDKIKETTKKYLKVFSGYPYIFNLGHGVLPETKPETIEYLVSLIREKK